MLPNVEASVQPVVCCFLLTVGATATRLGGLYIRLTPAILLLLETRETPYTLKNTSKPTKILSDQSLVLSTPLRVLALGLALERVLEQGVEPCALVLE